MKHYFRPGREDFRAAILKAMPKMLADGRAQSSVKDQAGEDINGFSVFHGSDSVTVYYLPGSIGWAPTFADRPTDLWELPYPVILNPQATRYDFGFTVSWATNAAVVVDFTTDLSSAAWFPVSTNVFDSAFQFSDTDWSIHPRRSYRVREIKSFTSVAPVIVREPESVTVEFLQTALFSVTASGTGPFTYQWRHNNVDLVNDGRVSGATNRTLIITEVIWGNAGGYHVVVRNGVGQAISSTAQLSVNEEEPPDFEPSGMVWLPQGTFSMGSPNTEVSRRSNEGPLTQVALTKGFYLGKYEVTQREYLDLVGSNPSYFTGDLDRPVETVSWFDATEYCRLLTQSHAAAGGAAGGVGIPFADRGTMGVRLPGGDHNTLWYRERNKPELDAGEFRWKSVWRRGCGAASWPDDDRGELRAQRVGVVRYAR